MTTDFAFAKDHHGAKFLGLAFLDGVNHLVPAHGVNLFIHDQALVMRRWRRLTLKSGASLQAHH
jgi:hypothetical protein